MSDLQAEEEIYELLDKNREALLQVVDRLCSEPYQLGGDEVRSLVVAHGQGVTLEQLEEDAATFL